MAAESPATLPKNERDGPLLSGTKVPRPLYLKVLDLVPLSATVSGRDQRRVLGILRMVTQQRQNRNITLNIAAFCFRELIGSGVVSREVAERLLFDAATLNGYVAKDGAAAALATIRSGLRTVEDHLARFADEASA